jgi:hypothetical protein
MDLGSLIETHGYWVLAAGCLLEGETILVLAGLAAERGYLHPFGVVVVASVTAFIGDQILFWLGRWRGPALLARWPSVAAKAGRVHELIERYHLPVIIGMRFAYGLRIPGPILIGMSPVAFRRDQRIRCRAVGLHRRRRRLAIRRGGGDRARRRQAHRSVAVRRPGGRRRRDLAGEKAAQKMKRPEGLRQRGVW